ncbi:LytR/AlgR family response regulator transcription factor [Saccharicrinis sp. FJH54]|uniref:LytR/AlgR family response regulator transcription factor n=1 Tax=Saccharicrinis sp. FJH54 TaxID=3344665 RepID=UPI0035D5155B
MSVIKCMIVEDEPFARKVLQNYIHQFEHLEIVMEAESSEQARDYLNLHSVDLIFLDINLPGTDGVAFYRSLKNPPKVILTTAYPEFAVDGFDIHAVDFLLKPFSYDRFASAVNKLFREIKQSETFKAEDVIFFKSSKRIYRVKYESIYYIEGLGDYVSVQTMDNKIIVHETMKDLEFQLRGYGFERIHKSFIVNSKHIEYIEGNQVSVNGRLVPVGKAYRHNILSSDNML